MERETATEVKRLTLEAIESLAKILQIESLTDDAEFYQFLHKSVGFLIGEADYMILAEVYKKFPDLDDLA